MVRLPSGTVSFLFAQVDDLAHPSDPDAIDVAELERLFDDACAARAGVRFGEADGTRAVAFERASDAVAMAADVQRALSRERPDGLLRIGVHSGEATSDGRTYGGQVPREAARICAAAHLGQILVSSVIADLVGSAASALSFTDLGLHRLKDLGGPKRLFQVAGDGLPDAFPPPRTLDTLPNNLPTQLSTFVGRDEAIAEGQALLGASRLVTLVGAGGTGKTRLALQVAAERVGDHADGVWFVDLATRMDATLIGAVVLDALGMGRDPSQMHRARLTGALRHSDRLIVLDNCEHVIDEVAALARDLLAECPRLWILATSRQRLGIAGERVWEVPPMIHPDVRELGLADQIAAYEAVRLFVERARAVSPRFALTPANAPAVARICARLDGLPLAIELAAARTRVLTPQQIEERLGDMMGLLVEGERFASPRQKTLHGAIAWSYDLLEEPEQILFERLSIFPGPFDVDAAEAVCADDDLDVSSVLDGIGLLVDRSLIARTGSDDARARYRMLEAIRAFASERLRARGDDAALRARHRHAYASVVGDLHPRLTGPEQGDVAERLDLIGDDLRAAMTTGLEDAPAEALALAVDLIPYWDLRAAQREGRAWLERAIDANQTSKTVMLARAHNGVAIMAMRLGDLDAADHHGSLARDLASALGDRTVAARAVMSLGSVARYREDSATAIRLTEEALEGLRAAGDDAMTARCLGNLGVLLSEVEDYARAVPLLEEAASVFAHAGDRLAGATVSMNLGTIYQDTGDHPRAEEVLRRALATFESLGHPRNVGMANMDLGNTLSSMERFAAAAEHYIRALEIGCALEWVDLVAIAAQPLAAIVARAGDPASAAVLVGATMGLTARGTTEPFRPSDTFEEIVGPIRSALGEQLFDAHLERGRSASLEEVRAVALRSASVAETPIAVPPEHNTIQRQGDVWVITFDGATVRLKDAKGLAYLAILLTDAGREHHVGDLVRAVEGTGGDDVARAASLGDAGEIIDERARLEYAARIVALEEELAEAEAWADEGRATRARAEIDALGSQLRSAYGLGGRARKAGDTSERMRKAVTNRIRDAIARIEEASPALGKHLRASVRTGTFCRYEPDRQMTWSGGVTA